MEEDANDAQKTPVGFPQAKVEDKKSRKVLIIVIIVVLVLVAVAAWFLLGNRASSPIDSEAVPTPSNQLPTPSPTPTEMPVEKDNVKINILNGTGITGAAGSLENKLKELGYGDIEVGNADKSTYTATEVTFSSNVPEQVKNEITDTLESTYKTVDTKSGTVEDFDIQIVTGIPVNYTPAPTKSPASPTPTSGAQTTTTPTPTTTLTGTPTTTPTPTP